MAKKITRTVTTTIAKVLVANPETGSTEIVDVTLCGDYKDDKKLAKAVKNAVASATCVFVSVRGHETIEELYGMDEETFVANAVKLPARKISKIER